MTYWKKGIIREIELSFASPILLKMEKDGKFRMCGDFRELNAHTLKDRYPLPITKNGFKRVLVIVTAFTKYCIFQPLKSVQIEEIKNAFQTFISLFVTPNQIIMDADKNFENLNIPEYLNTGYILPLHPSDIYKSNEQVERYMRSIMNLLRIETSLTTEWSNTLWKIQLVLNFSSA